MKSLIKNIRYYYWLLFSFIRKNLKLLVFSFILSFFLILLLINLFPFFSTLFFKKKESIGFIGKYNLQNVPEEITNLLSNPLVSVNEKGEIIPLLAKSWELSKDGKIYRFFLKSDLYWPDGKKFNAYDINYQFKEVLTKVIDDYTIEFTLKQPLSIFPLYLTKNILKYPLQGIAGLYQLESYKLNKGDLLVLCLTPNKEGLSFKTYKFYDTENRVITAYKKGEINIINTSKKNIADLFLPWKNTQIKKSINYNQILTVFFNNNSDLLSIKEIRKALAYSTPYFDQYGKQANGPILPMSWAYSLNLKKYPYNLEKAESLFNKNYSASISAELNFYTFYDYIDVAEQLKQNYEKLGLKINLQVLSYLPQSFDILLTMWNPPSDPDQYYFWHSTQKEGNITNYKNLKVDKLLEDGRKFISITDRKKIYYQFQDTIMDDLPASFIYYPYIYTIKRR